APESTDDDDEQALLDTLRVVRRLREPAEAEEEFESSLVRQTLAAFETASLVSSPNGVSEQTLPPRQPIELGQRRRVRFALAQIAAVLRVVGVFVLAGMLSGAVVGGLGGRVVMRVSGYLYQRENPGVTIVTESSGEPVGQVSLQGTIDLIVESAFSGAAIGLLLLLVAPWLPRSGWRRSGVFGLLLLAVVGSLVIDPDSRDLRTFGPALLNIVMFATLIVAAGMLTPLIFGWLDRSIGSRGSRLTRFGAAALRPVAVVLGGFGLLLLLPLTVTIGIFVPIGSLIDPQLESIMLIPLALVCALVLPLARVAEAFPSHLTALDRLRSELATRYVTVALWLLTAAGLLLLLTNTIRIAAG
ncbi:MAG: hypothetical protein ACRD1H_10765, partial [Vicinamibacterales bacterium]